MMGYGRKKINRILTKLRQLKLGGPGSGNYASRVVQRLWFDTFDIRHSDSGYVSWRTWHSVLYKLLWMNEWSVCLSCCSCTIVHSCNQIILILNCVKIYWTFEIFNFNISWSHLWTRDVLATLESPKIVFGRDSAPNPLGGIYNAPQIPSHLRWGTLSIHIFVVEF